MNPQSEIILEKMLDHFGEHEELLGKMKPKIQRVQKDVLRQRRGELLSSIEQIKLLSSNRFSAKNRREELLFTKKLLQAS